MSDALNPDRYGPLVAKLLREARTFDLGPGKPVEALRGMLKALTVKELFQGQPIENEFMANACLAGIWLYFDFLKESHAISQNIPSTTGSLWHGIMHRRETDYPNSKYWFEKVPTHPIYAPLQKAATGLAAPVPGAPTHLIHPARSWDSLAFVDLCQQHAGTHSPMESLCCGIQRCEWELLFDYSYTHATGGN